MMFGVFRRAILIFLSLEVSLEDERCLVRHSSPCYLVIPFLSHACVHVCVCDLLQYLVKWLFMNAPES